jgi:CO/xanthine dehydrogenase FAD-binding subunit
VTVNNYFLPQSLSEAVGLLAQHGASLVVMAGGTVAMPLINEGISLPEQVMGLKQAGLNYIRHTDGTVSIGAAVTLTQILELNAIPLLQEAAQATASWSIRNMGTVGGNIFTPPPGGDVAVALLALDATVKLVSGRGERVLPLADFFTGFMTNALQMDEILAEIQVPIPAGETAYLKYGRKHSNTPSIVAVAVHITRQGGKVSAARVGLNGVGPHPLRARRAEAVLLGSALDEDTIARAAAAAAQECRPFDDALASEWYRRKMVGVYVGRALAQIAAGKE